MDQASRNKLSKVHPELARRVEKTIAALAAAGLDVRVVQGLRTYEEQNTLYSQGRTRKGPRVTNARGGQSNHNFGLAVDLCPFDVEGKPDWNNDHAFTLIGTAGKTQKLEWGGDWTSFPDRPHLQLKTGLKTSTCDEMYRRHGLTSVWEKASEILDINKSESVHLAEVELEIPQIQKVREAHVEEPASQAAPNGSQHSDVPAATQTAENITNVVSSEKTVPDDFVAEDKTVEAPAKENSTATATKMTIAGFVVPTFLASAIAAIKQAIADGYVSAGQIGDVAISFISNNTKYVFAGLGLVIGGMMLKKLYKQITLWLSMYFAARQDMHDVTVKPSVEKR